MRRIRTATRTRIIRSGGHVARRQHWGGQGERKNEEATTYSHDGLR